jgi:two-component system, LytTR family, response regulator
MLHAYQSLPKKNYLYSLVPGRAREITMTNSGKITALIIDDDEFCCFQMQDLLGKYCHGIEVLATCASAAEGLRKIQELKPQLVFLDVEMPGMNGFEMVRKLPAVNFEIIFTTAHEHYAIRAIRFSALDYLVKPVDAVALQEAVSRMKDKLDHSEPAAQKPLEIVGIPSEKKFNNLAVPTMEGLLFIGIQDIIRCESDDKYTKIFLADKKMIMASRTLGDFEEILQPHGFFRIHKSYLINLAHLKKYLRGEGGQVIMTDGSTLDVSRRKKEELMGLVSQF